MAYSDRAENSYKQTRKTLLNRNKAAAFFLFLLFNCFALADLLPAVFNFQSIESELHRLGAWWIPTLTLLSFITWRLLGQRMFDFYPLFLFGALVFNTWFVAFYAYGLADLSDLRIRSFDVFTFYKAALFAFFSVSALHFGALVTADVRTRNYFKNQRVDLTKLFILRRKILLLIGFGLLIMVLPGAFFYYFDILSKVIAGGYSAIWDRSEADIGIQAAGQILSGFLVPSTFFILVAAAYGKKLGKKYTWLLIFSFLIVIAYSQIYMFVGRRAHMVMFAASYLIIFDRLIYRLPRFVLIGCAVVLIISFSVIKEVRHLQGDDRSLGFEKAAAGQFLPIVTDPLIEMATTIRTVYWAVHYFPHEKKFEVGKTYGWALTQIVPNVFWDIHPGVGKGIGAWLTEQYKRDRPQHMGGGVGSSFITEGYGNFGVYALFLFFIIGAGLQYFVQWADRGDLTRWIVVGTTFSAAFLFVRGESHNFVRDLFWYGMGPYLLYLLAVNCLRLINDQKYWKKLPL